MPRNYSPLLYEAPDCPHVKSLVELVCYSHPGLFTWYRLLHYLYLYIYFFNERFFLFALTNSYHYFKAKYGNSIPLLIFGGMSLVGAGLTFFLPETCDQVLPNTVEDANRFGEDQGYFDCIMCAPKRPVPSTMRKRLSTFSRTLHYSGQFPQELVEDIPMPIRKRWNSIYE